MRSGPKFNKSRTAEVSQEEEIRNLQEKIDDLQSENELLKKIVSSRRMPQVTSGKSQEAISGDIFRIPEFHKSFFYHVPFMMWAKDTNGRFIAVNSAFARNFGKEMTELHGLTDYDICPKIFADKFRSDDLAVIDSGNQITVDEQIPVLAGFRWHETTRIPLTDQNGMITGIAGFAKDITDRKHYETALRQSEAKFRELAENTNDSFILSSGNNIIYVNPAFEQVYGYSRDEFIRNPGLRDKWIYPPDAMRIRAVLDSAQYKSNYIFNEQYRIIKKDGTVSWIWNRSYPIWNDKGEAYRIVSVATNISGIKILEERLTKSQSQQQAILDNIPHLAWLKDTDSHYVSVNESFCRYYNKSSDEIVGKTDYFLCSKNLADEYISKDKEVIRERKSKLFFEVEDGRFGKRYSETHKTPIVNDEGEVIGIAGISRDITEQKLAEQALLRSEEKYKDLVNLLPEVVFETDAEGNITYVNLKGFELMGYSPQTVDRGINIFDIVASGERERARQAFANIRKGKEIKTNEYNVVTREGKVISVLVVANSMFQDSRWVGIRGVMVDITRRKMAENQEKEYQTKLLFLSNTALDFLGLPIEADIFKYIGMKLKEFVTDANIIVSSYDDTEKLLSIIYHSFSAKDADTLEEMTGIRLKQMVFDLGGEDIDELKLNAEHLKFFKGGIYDTCFGKFSRPLTRQIEKRFRIRKTFGMSLMRSGVLYGSALILTNRDELQDQPFLETFFYQASIALHRRQLELELVEAKVRAEETDMLKTAFLANMSHEIRTPMNGILGLTQLLTKDQLSHEDRKEYLAMINSNGKLLMNLVNDIIDISRIESNQVDLNEVRFSLNAMMNELLCFIQSEKMIKNKGSVELKMQIGLKDEDSGILSDQSKLKQVLTNLIGNAIKFTNRGNVEFGYSLEDNNSLKFFVKDSGIGISEDKLEVIFDRFTQVDQSLTRPYSGSGLGLAISKGFVERMGGRIWAESHIKRGATFNFTIPYKPIGRSGTGKEEFARSPDQFNWEKISILVVEDNYISYKLLEFSLSKTGVGIIHADNGQSAIDEVKKNPGIDLVLMDIQLPVLNGYDATIEIKKIRPELPVIAQTANAMDDDRLKCLNAGCSDYITKPIILEKLYAIINNYVIRAK